LRRQARAALVLAAAAGSVVGIAYANPRRERVLPDLLTHLAQADRSAKAGDWSATLAHANAILLVGEVRYSVDCGQMPAIYRPNCESAAALAASIWEESLWDEVQLTPSSPGLADVHIRFVPRRIGQSPQEAGHARWRRTVTIFAPGSFTSELDAAIDVYGLGNGGAPMSREQLVQIAVHEWGHVLGLKDSRRVGDLMGPVDLCRPVTRPSEEELAALREVRAQARELRRNSLLTALIEREGYNALRAAD
jgi:hypothetical protein